MRVEVDIYSGRPNPSWELSPAEAKEFLEMLRRLPQNAGAASVKEDLGYRGMTVTATEAETGGYEKLTVSNGSVVASGPSKSQHMTDEGRASERWLLQTGKPHLEADLHAYILSEIERG